MEEQTLKYMRKEALGQHKDMIAALVTYEAAVALRDSIDALKDQIPKSVENLIESNTKLAASNEKHETALAKSTTKNETAMVWLTRALVFVGIVQAVATVAQVGLQFTN